MGGPVGSIHHLKSAVESAKAVLDDQDWALSVSPKDWLLYQSFKSAIQSDLKVLFNSFDAAQEATRVHVKPTTPAIDRDEFEAWLTRTGCVATPSELDQYVSIVSSLPFPYQMLHPDKRIALKLYEKTLEQNQFLGIGLQVLLEAIGAMEKEPTM